MDRRQGETLLKRRTSLIMFRKTVLGGCVEFAWPRSLQQALCSINTLTPTFGQGMLLRQVFLSLFLFFVAGVAEIGGGWLVWQSVRLHKAWYLAVAGAVVLFAYGLIPCAQPVDNFGRVRAGAELFTGCTTLDGCARHTPSGTAWPYPARCVIRRWLWNRHRR
jgi:hypothetical protein